MSRFVLAVVAVGLALSSALASQGRGRFGGEGGSAPRVPELVQPAGAMKRGGGSYGSPGVEGATFELETPAFFQSATTQAVTVVEEHYRKQLAAAGWMVESSGGDANIAYSRFTIPATGGARAGTLVVTPIETGRVWVGIRMVQPMPPPAPRAPKTETEMMDWMLRQIARRAPGETPAFASALPGTFPTELLPAQFKTSRILSTGTGTTVAGIVAGSRPSDISTFFAGLRKAGWSDSLRAWLTETFVVAEFCKNDVRASIAFTVEPKRVVMAGVTTDKSENVGCEFSAKRSPGISGPVVVLPLDWAPAHVDGGGGGGSGGWHARSGMRLNTATPVASILADVESQIAASGYKAVARTSDANQGHVRFESTQVPGSAAVVVLSVTKLPWSPQIDAVFEVITVPRR